MDLEVLDGLMLRNNPVRGSVLDFARALRERGVCVLNDPDGLVAGASKTYLASLPASARPRTVVSRDIRVLSAFLSELGGTGVLKPVRGFGGRGVTLIEPEQAHRLPELVGDVIGRSDGYVVLQELLPRTSEGDKRILLVDGEPVGCYVRMRAEGEFRHNIHVGGRPAPGDLDESDLALCEALSGTLRRDGIFLAGLDVIGGRAVEVNVVATGGVANIERTSGRPVADRIVERLKERLSTSRGTKGRSDQRPSWAGAESRW